jgi:HSP20 family protein
MALVPWDPFKNILSLQERMNRLFDEAVNRGQAGDALTGPTWSPAVDIYETEEDIVIDAELPGMDKDDVDIQVRDNTLILKGERKVEKTVKDEGYHRMERMYGSFARTFTLPSTVDQERITATYDKGVLHIRMPKTEKTKPQQIKIEVKE